MKIDKTFIRDVPGNAGDVAPVKTIFSIAKHMKLKVVAEGVETQERGLMTTRASQAAHYCHLHWLHKSANDWRRAIHAYVLT